MITARISIRKLHVQRRKVDYCLALGAEDINHEYTIKFKTSIQILVRLCPRKVVFFYLTKFELSLKAS